MRRSSRAVSVGLVVLVSLASCTSRPSLVRERYAFAVPPPAAASPRGALRLALPSPEVATAFDRASFVYRTGESTFESDPYAQLLAPPRELLGEALRGHLRASGLFGQVTRTTRGADVVARILVTELYGDFRDPKAPAAVLALVVSVERPGKSGPSEQRGYARRTPIAARHPEALTRGLDTAIAEIAAEIASGLRAP